MSTVPPEGFAREQCPLVARIRDVRRLLTGLQQLAWPVVRLPTWCRLLGLGRDSEGLGRRNRH